MNVKLRNRQAIRGELSQFVDDMIIPEDMIYTLMEMPVSEPHYLEELQNLEHKINFLKEQSFRLDFLNKLFPRIVYNQYFTFFPEMQDPVMM